MEAVPRRALVTGAGKRIGRAMAVALAEHGFDVAIHYRSSRADAEATAAAVRERGRRAALVAADLMAEAEAARLVPDAEAALGPLGVLVNNASIFELDRLATAERRSWDRHMEINLRAPVVLAQHFMRRLPPAAGGVIVNLLDSRVENLTASFLSYSIARAGLWAATQVLARELAPRVRVNAIGPGPTLKHPQMDQEAFDGLVRSLPLRRGATPDELATALRFILDQPAMTGQMITLDGGQQLGWLAPKGPTVD